MNSKNTFNALSRRTFLQASTAAAAWMSQVKAGTASLEPVRGVEHGRPLGEFHYGQVQFPLGLHQSQLERTHGILMGLSEDSLLKPFRRSANLPAPGCDLGGWYSEGEIG